MFHWTKVVDAVDFVPLFQSWNLFCGGVSQGVALGCHVMALSAQPEMTAYPVTTSDNGGSLDRKTAGRGEPAGGLDGTAFAWAVEKGCRLWCCGALPVRGGHSMKKEPSKGLTDKSQRSGRDATKMRCRGLKNN